MMRPTIHGHVFFQVFDSVQGRVQSHVANSLWRYLWRELSSRDWTYVSITVNPRVRRRMVKELQR